jgi:hypothetical protein
MNGDDDPYDGSAPFAGLIRRQQNYIAAAAAILPGSWKEGYWRLIYGQLTGPPPYSSAAVEAAVIMTTATLGGGWAQLGLKILFNDALGFAVKGGLTANATIQ